MISFSDVSFRYRRQNGWIFDQFSWQLPQGKTVLLGPNGTGKTTLLSLAATFLLANKGQIRINKLDGGHWRERKAYRQCVGWMPQKIEAVPGLTVREQVAYAGWLKGMSKTAAWEAAETALKQVDMFPLATQKSNAISGGQLRRVGLAQAIVHTADVLLLDEPTVGLDPAQRTRFRSIILALPPTLPIVVSTHQTDDISELFDQVVVLYEGRILFEGATSQFMALGAGAAERKAEAAYGHLLKGVA